MGDFEHGLRSGASQSGGMFERCPPKFRVSPGHSSWDLGGFCTNPGISIARWLFLGFNDKEEVLGLTRPSPPISREFPVRLVGGFLRLRLPESKRGCWP